MSIGISGVCITERWVVCWRGAHARDVRYVWRGPTVAACCRAATLTLSTPSDMAVLLVGVIVVVVPSKVSNRVHAVTSVVVPS